MQLWHRLYGEFKEFKDLRDFKDLKDLRDFKDFRDLKGFKDFKGLMVRGTAFTKEALGRLRAGQ